MDNDHVIDSINELIEYVNSVPEISEAGLKNAKFPDEMIASLHNHIGNAKHYVSDELVAFNATDQFLSVKLAINELKEASDNLYTLHSHRITNDLVLDSLNRRTHELTEYLEKSMDPNF